MRALESLALAAPLLGVFAPPVVSQEDSGALRGGAQYVRIDGNATVRECDWFEARTDDHYGASVGYEWRRRMFGLELSGAYGEHDVFGSFSCLFGDVSAVVVQGTRSLRMTPIKLALNVHLFGRGSIDLYFGPVVGYYFFSGEAALDEDFSCGAQIGADWNLGGGFAINRAAR